MIDLPEWAFTSGKREREEPLTAIEHFVHENEPGGSADMDFRDQLEAALNEAFALGKASA